MINVMQQANTAAKVAIQAKNASSLHAGRLHTANPASSRLHPQSHAASSSATGAPAAHQPSTTATSAGLNPRQQYQLAKKALTVQHQITMD